KTPGRCKGLIGRLRWLTFPHRQPLLSIWWEANDNGTPPRKPINVPDDLAPRRRSPTWKRMLNWSRTPIAWMNEPETVNVETNRLLDLLERRISLLESLGMALQAANTDIVRFDISGLERRIHDQERLCDELQRLNSDIESVQVRCVERVREKEN